MNTTILIGLVALFGLGASFLWLAIVQVIRFFQKRRGIAQNDRLKKPTWVGWVGFSFAVLLMIIGQVANEDQKATKTNAAIITQLTKEGFTVLSIDYNSFSDDKATVSKAGVTYYCSIIKTDKWRLVNCQRTLN